MKDGRNAVGMMEFMESGKEGRRIEGRGGDMEGKNTGGKMRKEVPEGCPRPPV